MVTLCERGGRSVGTAGSAFWLGGVVAAAAFWGAGRGFQGVVASFFGGGRGGDVDGFFRGSPVTRGGGVGVWARASAAIAGGLIGGWGHGGRVRLREGKTG